MGGQLLAGELKYALVLAKCHSWRPSRFGPGRKAPSTESVFGLLILRWTKAGVLTHRLTDMEWHNVMLCTILPRKWVLT